VTAPAPTAKHSTWLSTAYTWLWAHTFKHWPSPVTEAAGGAVLLAIAIGAILLATHHPAWATFALATALNLVYGLKLDPNDAGQQSEIPDGLIREAVIVALTLAAHALGWV
jgi:hypothetical protein